VSHGHFDHNYLPAVQGSPIVIHQAGEYKVCGVTIIGENSWHDSHEGALRGANVLFRIETDGVTLCHFGDLGEPVDVATKKESFHADIWMLPVGGTYTIDSNEAWNYIETYQPKLVIHMHYRPLDGALDIADASIFLQRADKSQLSIFKNGQFKLDKAMLNTDKTKIIFMERYNGGK
jgi:L-ascorbate metabolism protein UlaG (beta-lactamase superfamily)